MKTVKLDITYKEPAGRLELFIRWIWAIPSYVVLVVLGLISCVCMLLQWFHILVMGKRNKMLQTWAQKYFTYYFKFASYFMLFTDERNPLMPED